VSPPNVTDAKDAKTADNGTRPPRDPGPWVVLALCLLGVAYLASIVAGLTPEDRRLGQAELLLLGLLLLLASGLLKGLEQLAWTKEGLQLKWKREIEAEQTRLSREVETLRFVLGHLVPDAEAGHLERLALGDPFPYRRHPAFDAELRHLRSLGFVEPVPGSPPEIAQLPAEGPDLRRRYRITTRGIKYLDLKRQAREADAGERAEPPPG
jgi:hypothetical protein